MELDITSPIKKRAFIAENDQLISIHVRNETLSKTIERNEIPIKVYFLVEVG